MKSLNKQNKRENNYSFKSKLKCYLKNTEKSYKYTKRGKGQALLGWLKILIIFNINILLENIKKFIN